MSTPSYMYNHAVATWAIAEAYSLTNHNPLLRGSIQRACDFLLKAQKVNGGWGYTSNGEADTSVTGWCVMALRAAKFAKFEVPEKSFTGAKNFLNSVTSEDFRTGYNLQNGNISYELPMIDTARIFSIERKYKDELKKNILSKELRDEFAKHNRTLSNMASIENMQLSGTKTSLGSHKKLSEMEAWLIIDNENRIKYQVMLTDDLLEVFLVKRMFAPSEAMTALAMSARIFMGTGKENASISEGSKVLSRYLPIWGDDASGLSLINYYYWHWGTIVMYQIGGKEWEMWNKKLTEILLAHQEKEGCKNGSWPPISKQCKAGGRIYCTTLNILSLEIYYRYGKLSF